MPDAAEEGDTGEEEPELAAELSKTAEYGVGVAGTAEPGDGGSTTAGKSEDAAAGGVVDAGGSVDGTAGKGGELGGPTGTCRVGRRTRFGEGVGAEESLVMEGVRVAKGKMVSINMT